MICQSCHQKKATLFLTQVFQGKINKISLCHLCAQAQGVEDPANLTLNQLFLGLGLELKEPPLITETLSCPSCGLKKEEFKKKMRLGCAQCYSVFREELLPLLGKMHSSLKHQGKTPEQFVTLAHERASLLELKKELEEAIRSEEYERAALLRDELKLKQK